MLRDLDAEYGPDSELPTLELRKRRSNENAWPFAPRYRDDPRLDHRARSPDPNLARLPAGRTLDFRGQIAQPPCEMLVVIQCWGLIMRYRIKLLTSRFSELREALDDDHVLKVVGLERVLIHRVVARGDHRDYTGKSVAPKRRVTFGWWDRKGQSCRVASDFLIRSTEPEQGTGR
jgi:hypothetical protein